MRAILAFSLAVATLLMPLVSSAQQVSCEVCLNHCKVNRDESTNICNSELVRSEGKKSVRDCLRMRDSTYRNCKGGFMCNPPQNGLPCQ
jgi:hypothetical protein